MMTNNIKTNHEMTAREFVKNISRMCEYRCETKQFCSGCHFDGFDGESGCILRNMGDDDVTAVEQWAAEHPEKKRKTYAEDFLYKFPKARTIKRLTKEEREVIHPNFCRSFLYGPTKCKEGQNYSGGHCVACWEELMPEVEE